MKRFHYAVLGIGAMLAGQHAAAQVPVSEQSTAPLPAGSQVSLRIEAQPLEQALQAFSVQSGLQVIFPAELTRTLRAPSVEGRYTPEAALKKLLENSGLGYTYVNARTIAINPLASNERAALAEDGTGDALEEVVVTARFREETVQEIGASVGAIGGREIERAGLQDFEDIAARTVGLSITDRGPNQNDVSIRGVSNAVDENLTDGGSGGPLVSQYLDDIPVSSPTASQKDFNLFDLARVEVIRGPQPTYFGEGSMGGTIRYFSANPRLNGESIDDGVMRAGISFTDGGEANYRIDNAVTVNMIPGVLGARLTGYYRDEAGYIDNPALGTRNINDYQSYGGRAVVLYQPAPQLSLRLAAHLGRDEQGDGSSVNYTGASKRLTFSALAPGAATDDFELFSLKADYDFGPATLTSITGHYERRRDAQIYDALNSVFFESVLGMPFPLLSKNESKDASFTQEFRLVTAFDSPVNFTAGLFYQDSKFDTRGAIGGPGFALVTVPSSEDGLDSDTSYETEQISGFAELTWSLTDRLRLIGGARYVHETATSTLREYVSIGGLEPPIPLLDFRPFLTDIGQPTSFEFKLDRVLPRGAVEFDLSDDVLLYASAAQGVRNGNLNGAVAALQVATLSGSFDEPAFLNALTYRDDDVVSYELGAKTQWLNRALTVNAALFYSEYNDPHVAVLVPFILIDNGPDARISGLEFESVWRMNEYASFSLNGAYTDAQFTQSALLVPFVTSIPELEYDVKKGNRLKNVPEYTLAFGADFTAPLPGGELSFTGHVDFEYLDSRYSSVQNIASGVLGSLALLNLRLGVQTDRWSLIGYVSNALNDIEYQSLEGITAEPFLTADGRLDYPITTAAVNRPRTVGLEFRMKY